MPVRPTTFLLATLTEAYLSFLVFSRKTHADKEVYFSPAIKTSTASFRLVMSVLILNVTQHAAVALLILSVPIQSVYNGRPQSNRTADRRAIYQQPPNEKWLCLQLVGEELYRLDDSDDFRFFSGKDFSSSFALFQNGSFSMARITKKLYSDVPIRLMS